MNWYYVLNGQQAGPIPEAQLDELARNGTIKADTLVWTEGMPNWLPYSQARSVQAAGQPPQAVGAMPGLVGAPMSPTFSRETAQRTVSVPAIGLIVVGAICVVVQLFGLASNLLGGAAARADAEAKLAQLPPDMQQFGDIMRSFMEYSYGPLGIGMAVIGLIGAGLMVFGGIKMKQLRSYGLAMTASIVATVGCLFGCCCLLTMPFGIWGIVVLVKPEVKAAFE